MMSEKKQRVLEERRASAEAKTLSPERSTLCDDLQARWIEALSEKGGVDFMTARERDAWLSSRRLLTLVYHGIPPKVRPRAWMTILGNEIQMTPALHEITLARTRSMRRRVHATVLRENARAKEQARVIAAAAVASDCVTTGDGVDGNAIVSTDGDDVEQSIADDDVGDDVGDTDAFEDDDDDESGAAVDGNKEASLMLIAADIPRTFPELRVFHGPHGPLYEDLLDLLLAYVALRPDVGYVQGMS